MKKILASVFALFSLLAQAQISPDYIRHPSSLPCGTNTYVQTLGSTSSTQATCDGPIYYGTASGTNTYTVTASPVPASYITGRTFVVTFTNANTSTATLNANGLGAKAIQKNGSALSSGDIAAGSTQDLVYDGTQFQLIGSSSGGSGTVTSIATTAPISGGTITTTGTISIADAAADGSTKGAATFTAADFNSSSGLISIDYTNGQAADATHKGFLTSTDWSTFNNKGSGTVTTTGSPASGNLTKFSGATSITNGDLSGDVTTSGTLAATVAKINGATLGTTTATSGNVLIANGTQWGSVAITGDISISSSGVVTISNASVTLGKIANASANSKVLGSGSSGSGTSYSELTVGTGLSISGTTISATGVAISPNSMYFGGGNDGDFVLDGTNTYATYFSKSGSVYTQVQQVFANNLTISGSAQIINPGFPLFVKGTATATTSASPAILPDAAGSHDGANGANNGGTVGAGGSAGTAHWYGVGNAGGAGGLGNTGVGSNGSNGGTAVANTFSLYPNGSGATYGGGGGAGGSAGGNGGQLSNSTYNTNEVPGPDLKFFSASGTIVGIAGGTGGGGGGGGGGDATNKGGSGGGGGGGGRVAFYAFATITARSSGTWIGHPGGNGGNGGNGTLGNTGGGGGGSGAVGGYINIIIGATTGAGTTLFDASGGTGGNGGSKNGTGVVGNGGKGGPSGRILCWYLADGTLHTAGQVDGTAASGSTGGAGGSAQVSL